MHRCQPDALSGGLRLELGHAGHFVRDSRAGRAGMRPDALLHLFEAWVDQRSDRRQRVHDEIGEHAEPARDRGEADAAHAVDRLLAFLAALKQGRRHRLLGAGEEVIDLGLGEAGLTHCRALLARPLADFLFGETSGD